MADGEPLRDAAADIVTDHARVVDPQDVEELDHSIRVGADPDRSSERAIAAAVAKEVDNDDAMAGRHEGDDICPQVP